MSPLGFLLVVGLGWFWGGLAMAVSVNGRGGRVTGDMVRFWVLGSGLMLAFLAAISTAMAPTS